MTISPSIQRVLDAISQRLPTLEAVAPHSERSSGFEDEIWNGRLLVRLQVRPEFRGGVDPHLDVFAEENDALQALETLSRQAFSWDETGYNFPRYLGDHGVQHYLLDDSPQGLAQVEAALKQVPVVSEAERAEIREQLRYA